MFKKIGNIDKNTKTIRIKINNNNNKYSDILYVNNQ